MRALDRFGLSPDGSATRSRPSRSASSRGTPLLDLDYAEDSSADTDMNVVMTGDGRLVEVQATAERDPFARETLDELLELAAAGIGESRRCRQRRSRVSSLSSAIVAAPTIGWPEVLLRLFIAAVLGGAIGVERELRERQAGLRTHLVVSVGAALFTLVSAYGFTRLRRSESIRRGSRPRS